MSHYEEDIVILLRKICALALPQSFDASEDTNRRILLEKIRIQKNEMYLPINDFLVAFESRQFIISDYQLKLKAADIWKMQMDLFESTLRKRIDSLQQACKGHSIDINYELGKLMDGWQL